MQLNAMPAEPKPGKGIPQAGEKFGKIDFQEIIEQAPDPIVTLDNLGFVKYINRAAEKVSGYKRDDILDKHFAQLGVVAPSSLPVAIKEFAKTVSGNPGPAFKLDIIRKDKSTLIVEVNHNPIIQGGRIVGINLIMRYFGERKK